MQAQIARQAADASGDDPAFVEQVTDFRSDIARLEKKAGGKTAGKSSLARRVEQKTL